MFVIVLILSTRRHLKYVNINVVQTKHYLKIDNKINTFKKLELNRINFNYQLEQTSFAMLAELAMSHSMLQRLSKKQDHTI